MVENMIDAIVAAFRLMFWFSDWFAGGKERRIEIRCYDLNDDSPIAIVTVHRFRTKLTVSLK